MNLKQNNTRPDSESTLAQWLQYIGTIHPERIDLSLQRVASVASDLNLLQLDSHVIMIAGTNGKGSCVKILESIYLAAGYSVAASTSPHLLCFNERLRINGHDVSDGELITAFNIVEFERKEIILSYFTELQVKENDKYRLFNEYFVNFYNFCFELPLKNMVRECQNFK